MTDQLNWTAQSVVANTAEDNAVGIHLSEWNL
jgi:hypothetical protein